MQILDKHLFTVLEGIDGCAKGTQGELLKERIIRETRRKCFLLKSPNYESETGQLIDAHLKGKWFAADAREGVHSGDALVFQALQTVNRYADNGRLKGHIQDGFVIHDRYYQSGLVYGRLDGLDAGWLDRIHEDLVQPDLVILLDVTVEESIRRRPERRDRYEADDSFIRRVRHGYLDLFGEAGLQGKPYEIVDGYGTIEEVHERIWEVWTRYLGVVPSRLAHL